MGMWLSDEAALGSVSGGSHVSSPIPPTHQKKALCYPEDRIGELIVDQTMQASMHSLNV